MSSTKKMIELNVRQKMEVLEFAATHSERDTAKKFSISKTTVNNIKKRKIEITQRYNEKSHNQQRKRRSTNFDEINKRVLTWFHKMRTIEGRISGPMLQEVAMKIAQHLNLTQFKASNGWLESFKKRNGISQKSLSGDDSKEVAPPEVVTDFPNNFLELCEGFSPANIFNAGECGLFFKAMPDRTLAIKGDECKSGRMSKQRLTVLLAVSATGEKLKPLVIGKSLQPRCFKNININNLPVLWRADKKAWMTADLFTEWLSNINTQMMEEKRKILVFIDDCPAHPKVHDFSHIKLQFLPSLLQPLNYGIITNFKFFYRNSLLSSVVAKVNIGNTISDIVESINVLQSVLWISEAWNNVRAETISKCFRKSGFNFPEEIPQTIEIKVESSEVQVMDDFITCDDQVSCRENFSIDQVLECVLNEGTEENEESNDDYDEKDEDLSSFSDLSSLSFEEVSKMLENILKFATAKFPDILVPISEAKSKISQEISKSQLNTSKQKTIYDYFKTDT